MSVETRRATNPVLLIVSKTPNCRRNVTVVTNTQQPIPVPFRLITRLRYRKAQRNAFVRGRLLTLWDGRARSSRLVCYRPSIRISVKLRKVALLLRGMTNPGVLSPEAKPDAMSV